MGRYDQTYTSFSGADIVAVITLPNGKPRVLGELQTISYSTYRPTAPVYALGQIGAKGVVRGARTVAGSLIFTVFDRHVLHDVLQDFNSNNEQGYKSNKVDQLPAFDIVIQFLNEYGQSAKLCIYGVHLISEGQTMSVEDMITESTMEFIAMDVDSMTPDYA
ncbi:virion structural protein [Priestia megaterium]